MTTNLRDDHQQLILVAPRPLLARLDRSDDWMPGGLRVRRGMAIGGVVAAPDVAALETDAQMTPCRTSREALGAAVDGIRQLGD